MEIERAKCPDDWLSYIKDLAVRHIMEAGYYALADIKTRLAAVMTAEKIGLPSPDPLGRSSTELQTLITDSEAAVKKLYDAIVAAKSVAEINTLLAEALKQGMDWLVGPDWEPYASDCNWGDNAKQV